MVPGSERRGESWATYRFSCTTGPEYLRISAMKAWQIFGVGIAVLVAALLLPSYESVLAGLTAVGMVAVVVAGFLFRPRKDVFYLRTTLVISKLIAGSP